MNTKTDVIFYKNNPILNKMGGDAKTGKFSST